MAATQVLKATHTVDDTGRVRGVADIALGVGNRVAGVSDQVLDVGVRVQDVGDHIQGVSNQIQGLDDKVTAVMDGAQYVFYLLSWNCLTNTHLGEKDARRSWSLNRIHVGHAGSIILTGNQSRQNLRRWLLPPDPSMNHNIACNAHHKGTATWFFEGRTYKEWKSTGSDSLLWIHGKRTSLSHSAA